MSRPGTSGLLALVLLGLLLPWAAAAQTAPPLRATLSFESPPPDLTFNPTTPIKINLLLTNVSGAPIITVDGFSSTEFWRQLYFQLEGVGTITDRFASTAHSFVPFGTCHYRNSVLPPGAGIQVTPVEVLPGDFAVQFAFDDARAHFDLSRPGRYTVNARITFFAYDPGAIITDCNIEFFGKSLLSIGDKATVGRQEFSIVSNGLEFFIAGDTVPPTTTVLQSPAANGAGWSNQDVTLTFTAADNPGGSGVKDITVTLFGAQAGTQTIAGPSGSAGVTAEGTTTAFFNAEDNAGNKEAIKSQTVRIDKTPPAVTPPASITVVATEAGGARGSASPALATFLGAGSAVDNLDQSPARLAPQVGGVDANNSTLFPPGSTMVRFRFRDVAGNTGSANSSVTVVAGQPAISGAVVRSGALNPAIHFYDLRFTNTGTSIARAVVLTRFSFQTLAGVGNVSYESSRSPRLPIALGDLAVGASRTIRVFLVVPPPVKRFAVTESGQLRDAAGTTSSFSTSQTVSRQGDRDEFDEDRDRGRKDEDRDRGRQEDR